MSKANRTVHVRSPIVGPASLIVRAWATFNQPLGLDSPKTDVVEKPDHKWAVAWGALIFVATICIRLTCWYYARAEAVKVQTAVTNNYKRLAHLLLREGLPAFYDPASQMSNPDLLGHPPGYPLLLALIYKLFGESDLAVQLVQITADAGAAVVIFLIACELLSPRKGIIAGLLAALSPQFSWNSILILPDTISVLPILLAVYLLVHYRKNISWKVLFLTGVLIGVSTLLRANSLLLAPFLAGLILLRIVPHRASLDTTIGGVYGATPPQLQQRLAFRRIGLAASLCAGSLILIAPVTIRNAIVFRHFIPVSLGAGQTLLEGIADYDSERRFNIPETDVGIAEMEASAEQRPDYATTLFGPDGIKRERQRLSRGMAVIKANPFWFAGVMLQRSAAMLRFERVPIISLDPAHKLEYPALLRLIQRIFLTAFMVPLALGGVILLALAHRWSKLGILLAVPVYYFCFQSALHTEYRYVIGLNYFLLVFAAISMDTLISLGQRIWRWLTPARQSV